MAIFYAEKEERMIKGEEKTSTVFKIGTNQGSNE